MLKCTERNKQQILDYIGDDYGKCLYLYIDLKKYGLSNENVSMWWQLDEQGAIRAIALKYYTGMHLYSRDNDFDAKDAADLIMRELPSMVCAMKETTDKVAEHMDGYSQEVGIVLRLEHYENIFSPDVYAASYDELREIADVLSEDEALGKPYENDLLYQQLAERYKEKFGRNYLLRDGENKIISHVATYAELDNLAIVSGGFVSPAYRGQGQYGKILGSMCRYLLEEGKDIYSYHYDAGQSAHKSVGFEKLGDWAKLVRQ